MLRQPYSREKDFVLFVQNAVVSEQHSLLVGNVGKKCHLASSLDSYSELSLMESAVAGNTSGEDLSSLGNELSELCNILVVDAVYLVLTEDTNLLSSVILTEGGTLSIVSFHCENLTFPTHDFYITHTAVSLAAWRTQFDFV